MSFYARPAKNLRRIRRHRRLLNSADKKARKELGLKKWVLASPVNCRVLAGVHLSYAEAVYLWLEPKDGCEHVWVPYGSKTAICRKCKGVQDDN